MACLSPFCVSAVTDVQFCLFYLPAIAPRACHCFACRCDGGRRRRGPRLQTHSAPRARDQGRRAQASARDREGAPSADLISRLVHKSGTAKVGRVRFIWVANAACKADRETATWRSERGLRTSLWEQKTHRPCVCRGSQMRLRLARVCAAGQGNGDAQRRGDTVVRPTLTFPVCVPPRPWAREGLCAAGTRRSMRIWLRR